jgi:uncharacterized protein YcfJ
MNNTAMAATASLLACGAAFGAWRAGNLSPQYADVVQATPVTVSEPLYADSARVGERQRVVGYQVLWRWRDRSGLVRMDARPGRRLPIVDGAIIEVRRAAPAPASG